MTEEGHPILKTHPHLRSFYQFISKLNEESERGQVLISAAVLDDLLMQVVLAFLIDGKSAKKLLSGFNAPLGTLSSRIEIAHSLGLIGRKEHGDANTIRSIRNEFAHELDVSFESKGIVEKCASLHFAAPDYGDIVISTRGKFSSAATALILRLTNRPHYVSKKRCAWEEWPF